MYLAGFRAGSRLAGYRLEAQVGKGGMAVVFRARDERLDRLVALKILAPELTEDQTFRRRFIAESRAAAAVDDPHILPVYEAGEADGVLFIAMRFVKGGDLRRVLEREGMLTPVRAAGFISPVASALDAAHGAGLVHRDVKPANILVDARPNRPDHVYLSDFGVSKRDTASMRTRPGLYLGTPDYSAPEQIQGRAVDGRTDQYALGCVLYQLLTGQVPFERDQGMAVLLAHLAEPPPSLGARLPGLPAAVDGVLARALAKVPEKRYGSCEDFADALREALGLDPYVSRGATPAPAHPPARISWSAASGSMKAALPADPEAAATTEAVTWQPADDQLTELGESPRQAAERRTAESSGVGDEAEQIRGGSAGHRRKGRLWVAGGILTAAVVTAVAVVLATASSSSTSTLQPSPTTSTRLSPPTPRSSVRYLTLQDLRPGDCLTGSNLSLNTSNSFPTTIEAVSCSQRHIAEAFYSSNSWAANKAFPGDTAAGNQATAVCDKAFTAYIGLPPSSSGYSFKVAYPGSGDWATGDRSVQCVAYLPTTSDPGGAPLYVSIRGSET
jgi:serine/threonine protein kinase